MTNLIERESMTACLIEQDRLSRDLRIRKNANDQSAQKIYGEHLSKVGSPESLLFACRLALLESRTSRVFDSAYFEEKPAQIAEITKINIESQKIYLDMVSFHHAGNQPRHILIQSDTEKHLQLLRLKGFSQHNSGDATESLIELLSHQST
ncbi:MAG: hypothetical protein WAV41_02445 [Microgenomates group bacterium]